MNPSAAAACSATDGHYTTPQAYGDPTTSGAPLLHSQSAYSLQSEAGPRLYPTLESCLPPPRQPVLNAVVSTGPAAYAANKGCCTVQQAHGHPTNSEETLQQCQSDAAPRLYPTLEPYQTPLPQLSHDATVSTAPIKTDSPSVLRRNGISTYVICSFFNLVCCCLPLGIVAVAYSLKVYWASTDTAAKRYSTKARVFNIAASCIGFLLIAGGLAYLFLGGVVTWKRSNVPSREPTVEIVIPAAHEEDTWTRILANL